ncbi:MAG: NTP transferase domain-containing protein [Candidatus Heimdallarchaeota archaeon]|nr:NTP transferase domain-containing protein [Candidatus Heimdallarchaeota archaeon]
MRCIIPAAGKGTRLRPHTHAKPKALLPLGNQPIIAHIMNQVIDAGITDIIIIVGYEKEKLIKYVTNRFSQKCKLTFLEQKERKGLGHAIYMASEFLDEEPVLIALGDSIYEKSFTNMLQMFEKFPSWAGALTVKEVSNPQAYGVVITESDSSVAIRLVEKPKEPKSNQAITGIYMIRNSIALLKALKTMVTADSKGAGGEIQLTDALQRMIDDGSILGTINSGKWFDCGKKESLLEANRFILSKNKESEIYSKMENSIIIHPVAIQENCHISNSIIGPYVSIASGTTIKRGILSSSIIGNRTSIENVNLNDSIIGDEVKLVGTLSDFNIGDNSNIQFS